MKLQALFVLLIATNIVAAPTHSPGVSPVHYVSPGGAHVPPFTTWDNAANDIQSAIDVADDGDMVLVGDGHYLLNWSAISVTKSITIQSVNGPSSTIVDGQGNARCFKLEDVNCTLSGLTLTNGRDWNNGFGGAIYCPRNASNPVFTNCTIIGNNAPVGGGIYYGTAIDCRIMDNTSAYGGGMYGGTASSCAISGNSANDGGGMFGGLAYNCTISSNTAHYGGGMDSGTADSCTISGNTADYGGGIRSVTADNCTIYSNTARYGGGTAGGMASNCTVRGNSALIDGGGMYYGTADHCTVSGNTAYHDGGGMDNGTAIHSTFSNNASVRNGGGMSSGFAENCIVVGNSANGFAGGIYNVTAINCVINGNSSYLSGGGIYRGEAFNCTLSGNRAGTRGGGVSDATINNCIVWCNDANDGKDVFNSVMMHSCSPDAVHGVDGNITNAPLLVSASHIAENSPCKGTGSSSYSSGEDIDGEGWLTPPSIGCDEYHGVGTRTGEVAVAIEGSLHAVAGHPLRFYADVQGKATIHTWDFGDGTQETNTLYPQHVWTLPGSYSIELGAYNDTYPGGEFVTQIVQVVSLAESAMYVAAETGSDENDGLSWATSKATIQAGVDEQLYEGGILWVSNGTYNLTAEIKVDRSIAIRSVNGADSTVVDGNLSDRCFNLDGKENVLDGFTVKNGLTSSLGGGIRCSDNSTVVKNCLIHSNSAQSGAGVYGGTVRDCIVADNSANFIGGGVDDASVFNCIVTNNSARLAGGLDLGYGADSRGGIAGSAYNCLIVGNSAQEGGGVRGGIVGNCIIADNIAVSIGGGMLVGTAYNSIILGNTAAVDNNISDLTAYFSCSPGLVHGSDGNITNAPLFIDPDNGDYSLLATSPCIDAGSNGVVTTTTDLAGMSRIVDGDLDGTATVDMGAYEFAVQAVPVEIMVSTINLKSKGRTPVAVITTAVFDAATLDPITIRFAGASPVHCSMEDVDGDGDIDLKLHFMTADLGIDPADEEVMLIGQTYDGVLVMGMDAVKIVPKM